MVIAVLSVTLAVLNVPVVRAARDRMSTRLESSD